MNRYHFAARAALTALFALVIAACGAGPTPTPSPAPTQTAIPTETAIPPATPTPRPAAVLPQADPSQRATVRFLYAGSGDPIDAYLEGVLLAGGLRPGLPSGSTTPPAGAYQLYVRPNRQPEGEPILKAAVTLTAGESVIFILRQTPDGLILLRYVEDLRATANGSTRVAVINAVNGNLSASAFLDDVPLGAAASGGQATPAQDFAPTRVTFRADAGGQTVLREALALQARQAYTLILYGEAGGQIRLAQVVSPTRRETRIRLVNAYPREKALDVYLGENRIAQALAYGAVLPYAAYPSGDYTIRLAVPGGGPEIAAPYEGRLTLPDDQQGVLAFFVNTQPNGQDALGAVFFPESTAPIPAGRARLTLINLVGQRPVILPFNPSNPINGFTPIGYGEASPPVDLSVGRITLAVNTVSTGLQNTVEQVEGMEFRPNISYTYVVLGRPGQRTIFETDLSAAAAAAAIATPTDAVRVRLLHALIGVGAVDLIVGDDVVAQNVSYGRASGFVAIANPIRPARLVRAGTDELITQTALRLTPRGTLTFLATGTAAQPQLFQADERTFPSGNTAVLRVLHAAPEGGPITIESTTTFPAGRVANPNQPTPTPIQRTSTYVSRLPYPDLSRSVSLREGVYTLQAKNPANGALLGEITLTVEAGKRYDILIAPGDGGPGSVRLLLIEG